MALGNMPGDRRNIGSAIVALSSPNMAGKI
jgi:hypothetical protein